MIYSLHVPPEIISALREEFTRHVVKYGRNRFPLQPAGRGDNGRPLCTGCHKEVPKHRRSWCSDACYDRYVPQRVCYYVHQRDGGVCCGCGETIENLTAIWRARKPLELTREFNNACWARGVRPWETEEYKEHQRLQTAWCKQRPCEEYDHIIPFSEGGLTILENMRTVCSPCHRQITRAFHARRAEERRYAKIAAA